MNVNHPGARLIWAEHHAVVLRHPILRLGYGINRNLPEVARLDEIIQGLRRSLLVERIVVDRLPHDHQVLL